MTLEAPATLAATLQPEEEEEEEEKKKKKSGEEERKEGLEEEEAGESGRREEWGMGISNTDSYHSAGCWGSLLGEFPWSGCSRGLDPYPDFPTSSHK